MEAPGKPGQQEVDRQASPKTADTWTDATIDAAADSEATVHDAAVPHRSDSDALWASCSELAARYQVNGELLRPKLARLMRDDDSAYREVQNRGPNDPRYLFRIEKVRPIIESMRGAGA